MPRQTGWKGAKESHHHEQRVERHETWVSGFPGIMFIDVDGPIGRWGRRVVQKDFGLVKLDDGCHMAMTVAMTMLIAISYVQERRGVSDTRSAPLCLVNMKWIGGRCDC